MLHDQQNDERAATRGPSEDSQSSNLFVFNKFGSGQPDALFVAVEKGTNK
jgi:hypothetical protein